MEIGTTIRTIRKERGLSQKALAEKSGISANALCSIEKEKSFPSKETIKAISHSLQVPVGYLLFASITEDDIPQDKLAVFNTLREPILNCLIYDK